MINKIFKHVPIQKNKTYNQKKIKFFVLKFIKKLENIYKNHAKNLLAPLFDIHVQFQSYLILD